jgi:hypothetical protein
MPTSRDRGNASGADALASAVSEQMPGWKLVPSSSGADALEAPEGGSGAQQGADIETLRRKFLGEDGGAVDNTSTAGVAARVREQVEVFKVEPTAGGPVRVAERRNGKIRIVSG